MEFLGEWGLWTERMRKETAVHVVGVRGFFRGIKRSVVAAAVLLAFDVAFSGSILLSTVFCPIWILVSLLKNAMQCPGWGLALVRVGIPASVVPKFVCEQKGRGRWAQGSSEQ
jgi:hypothetical protein